MKKVPNKVSQKGVTLLETVIFVFVLGLIFLAIAVMTTQSIQRSRFNARKILATRYAEAANEWLRGEKEYSWNEFAARASGGTNGKYCLNEEIIVCDPIGSENTCWDDAYDEATCLYTFKDAYRRDVTLTVNGSRIDAQVVVAWEDAGNSYNVTIEKTFSRWE